jgi:endonuclease/exonuclease/phosphatase family metal-dependent hydrolase
MEVTIHKRTTAGRLERESISLSSQISRAGFLISVSYTCFLSLLILTQFIHSVTWHVLDPAGSPWSSSALLLAACCFGGLVCCPCLLNNHFMASLLPLPGPRTVILGTGVLLSATGFFSVLCQPRTADRYVKTKLIFEVYRFAIPTSLVLLSVWRWSNADIDPSISERFWYIKLIFGLAGYLCAFTTGASYLVHDSRITPSGMLSDMAKDPLPSPDEYDSASDPMLSTSIAAFSLWENLLWLPAGVSLGSAVFLSTFVFCSVAQICRWNKLDPYEDGWILVLALFFGCVVRLALANKLRDVDGLVHAADCGATTSALWLGLLLFTYQGGALVGFWGALLAVLAAASMWHHVLRLAEVRAVGAHAGLTLVAGGLTLLAMWFLSIATVFGGALPLGERYRLQEGGGGGGGGCGECEAVAVLSGLHVALATAGAMGGPLLHAVWAAVAAQRERRARRARRQAEADKYIVTGDGGAGDSAAEKDAMLALEDKKRPTSSGGGGGGGGGGGELAAAAAAPTAPHVNAGAPVQKVVPLSEGFGVLLVIGFVVVGPGFIARVLSHGGGAGEISALEGEFITLVSWNINFGWTTEGMTNVHDVAERLRQQDAGVVALQDANALQWPLGSSDIVGYLATELGMHSHIGLPTSDAGDTGNPLLSKYKLLLAQTHILPSAQQHVNGSCGHECPSPQRTITEARLLVGDIPVTIINTQLERVDGVRAHAQDTAERIRYVERIANATTTPILVVGGLGIEPTDPLLDGLLRSGTGMSSAINGELLNTTVPAARRVAAQFDRTEVVGSKTVDYVLYRGLLLVGFGYVIDDGVYEQPSDHLPLVASFKVRTS